jgi:hypothetical protein
MNVLTQKGPAKMIRVERTNGEKFEVTVSEQNSSTIHTVTLEDDYYQALTDGKITEEDFVKKCFEFLLEREGKESILSSFNVKVIKSYFPEFEQQIKGKID